MEALDKNMTVLVQGIDVLSFTGLNESFANVNYSGHHIHRLPVELLQHILLLIVNDIPDSPSIFSFEDTTVSANVAGPPLVFTRVCRLWRVLAHSTWTGVWSRIQVALPGRVEPLGPFLPSLLQFWLAFSDSRPLTLSVASGLRRVPFRCTWPASEANSQVLNILLSESGRWETVTVTSPVDDDFDTPQLRTLGCHWSDLSRFNAPNLSLLPPDSNLLLPATVYAISTSRMLPPVSYAPL
ncbi:uncharacterized protein EDB91DRAFT_1249634 [Suillus paluster]|uniref:uncharacterized protein n=1 Tax=Suillus paluster TaxID=48578 RepID=UPI001B880520|nr:uncharacterized protein EDB91DRAFT_1249634 [Suillus paluster]KAG1737507.1 hypothetical protein EDB91DRAFT_1249634 [Suillus paluster]